MGCEPYDASSDRAVIESMLAGQGLTAAVGAPSRPTRLLAVGDSILAESHGYLVPLAAAHGVDVTVHAVGGTAPCDWIEPLETILPTVDPDVVVFSFSGNAFTDCMADRPIGTAGFYEQYEESAAQLTSRAVAAGGEVWWMEVLPFGTESAELDRAPLDVMYAETADVAGLVPSRTLFESDQGGFATELECRFAWEPCEELRVRSDDGVHLGSESSPYGPIRYAVAISAFADCWSDHQAEVRS